MLCGLVKIPSMKATTANLGFEFKAKYSERMRKKVYIASNWPQTAALKTTAGLKAYNVVAISAILKVKRFRTKANMRNAVAMSKRFGGNFITYVKKLLPKSDKFLASKPKTQKK